MRLEECKSQQDIELVLDEMGLPKDKLIRNNYLEQHMHVVNVSNVGALSIDEIYNSTLEMFLDSLSWQAQV